MRGARCSVVWALFVIPILGCGEDPISQSYTTPDEILPFSGQIAFSSNRDGDFEILPDERQWYFSRANDGE